MIYPVLLHFAACSTFTTGMDYFFLLGWCHSSLLLLLLGKCIHSAYLLTSWTDTAAACFRHYYWAIDQLSIWMPTTLPTFKFDARSACLHYYYLLLPHGNGHLLHKGSYMPSAWPDTAAQLVSCLLLWYYRYYLYFCLVRYCGSVIEVKPLLLPSYMCSLAPNTGGVKLGGQKGNW